MKKIVWVLALLMVMPLGVQAQEKMEREGAVTMRGEPVTLIGPEIKAGQPAPDFTVQANDLSDVSLAGLKGRVKLIASVPSVDTRVCDLEIRRFNEEAANLSENMSVLIVSMDLPFAQRRFCAAEGIENVQTLSDHRTAEFGERYGVLMKDSRLLARAVFVIDENDVVRHVEYVKDTGQHPDYDAALGALREIAGK